jgi:poly(A) polymerase
MTAEGPRPYYVRVPNGPLMRGDHVDEARVLGFAYVCGAPRGRGDDRLLIEGDEHLLQPPERPVPAPTSAVIVTRTGVLPTEPLLDDQIHLAAEIMPGLNAAMRTALTSGGADRSQFIDALLAEAENQGHLVWLVGGAVRDLIAGGSADELKDLDFAGTVRLGELWEWVEDGALAVRADASDYRFRTSLGRVWSVRERTDRPAFLEYKALALEEFHFPACGGDLRQDAATRDLTVNCLYYDRKLELVLDPTGHGLPDLLGTQRRLASPNHSAQPAEQAKVVLRGLKFILRWRRQGIDFTDTDLQAWMEGLPADLAERLDADAREGLRQACDAYREKSTPEELVAAARALGPVAASLIDAIGAARTS